MQETGTRMDQQMPGGHLTLFHSLVPESCTPPKHTHQEIQEIQEFNSISRSIQAAHSRHIRGCCCWLRVFGLFCMRSWPASSSPNGAPNWPVRREPPSLRHIAHLVNVLLATGHPRAGMTAKLSAHVYSMAEQITKRLPSIPSPPTLAL